MAKFHVDVYYCVPGSISKDIWASGSTRLFSKEELADWLYCQSEPILITKIVQLHTAPQQNAAPHHHENVI